MLYHYPGNVRELQYTIERGVIMADSDVLKAEDITFSPLEQQEEMPNRYRHIIWMIWRRQPSNRSFKT